MKKSKSLQKFNLERLKKDKFLNKSEIAHFLNDFQAITSGDEGPRKLISLRVPQKLLERFKNNSRRKGVAYQTQIVQLMRDWVLNQ